MGKGCSSERSLWSGASLLPILVFALIFTAFLEGFAPNAMTLVRGQPAAGSTFIAPSKSWGTFVGTSGDIQVDINRTGIAARVEIPREFLQGVISRENDSRFIQSNIRNDYYYYSVVDESNHWTYAWHGLPSDGACFKPNFSLRDLNAPWCVEIWNYLNGKFLNFTAPKFIRFHNLKAPSVAGIYNFTLFVANRTNSIGYPDFVHAWNRTLFVPVSMSDDPASISGIICEADALPPPSCAKPILNDKAVVYATNVNTGQIARAFVDETDARFNITGLAPGSYVVQGSAGLVNGLAYSFSDPQPPSQYIIVINGESKSMGFLFLNRAPQVCGQLTYESTPGVALAHSYSEHPFLKTVLGSSPPVKLNITIEATDKQGHTYRYMNTSLDTSTDFFRLTTGSNITYVGTDPYGTEFAGLPPITSGSYTLTLSVWITGYLQAVPENVTVSTAPAANPPFSCNQVSSNPVVMLAGGVISGTIQLWNLATTETPNQAKQSLGLSSDLDPLFGGNILIQAYDHSGLLRGVVVNGTIPTLSGNVNTIRFYVIGFSEYANHTWSGVWDQKDYGLPADDGYNLQVYIRGYEQADSPTISVPQGGNSTVNVRMTRGGLFQVTVQSFDNRIGTRATQALVQWKFLNLSIPVRARVYFYLSGRTIGFSETIMQIGVNHGVGLNSFQIRFTGQNWNVREIWFYGEVPTHITNGTYSINAYTLGYVQQIPVTSQNDLLGLGQSFITLLLANDIEVTAPVFASPSILTKTTENEFPVGEAFGGNGLEGALPVNASTNVASFPFSIFGFGAWTSITCSPAGCGSQFLGQGHFFYVTSDGFLHFDYGLDTGNYTTSIPEFGFTSHLTQTAPPRLVGFTDLSQEEGFVLGLVTMGSIRVDVEPLVRGWVRSEIPPNVPLSWVTVQAIGANLSRSVPTLDGQYEGVGALFLPQGIYNLTFSVAFFKSQSDVILSVQWGQTYTATLPDGPLCPTGNIAGVCDPPSNLSMPKPLVPSFEHPSLGLLTDLEPRPVWSVRTICLGKVFADEDTALTQVRTMVKLFKFAFPWASETQRELGGAA